MSFTKLQSILVFIKNKELTSCGVLQVVVMSCPEVVLVYHVILRGSAVVHILTQFVANYQDLSFLTGLMMGHALTCT